MNQFVKDEQKLIEYHYKQLFLEKIPKSEKEKKNDQNFNTYHLINTHLELIIRPECNQKCEYCYITKYGKELYPFEDRGTKEQLIQNCSILLTHLDNNKIIVPDIELFAGDLFYDDIIYSLFEEIYKYYSKIYNIEFYNFNKQKYIACIGVPTNFSFVNNEKHLILCKEWKEKFKKIHIALNFSCSVDGKFATEAREKKKETEVDEYYNKIINAVQELDAGLHPMISAYSIDQACENYDWWLEQLEKINRKKDIQPMMIEVRNGKEWTSEKINSYLKFLQHVVDRRLQMCHNSIDLFAKLLFDNQADKDDNVPFQTFPKHDNLILKLNYLNNQGTWKQRSSCSISDTLNIVLSNFALVPCHRTSYYQFIGGWLQFDENCNLIEIKPNNVSAYLGIKYCHYHIMPKCISCSIAPFCEKGCLGAQYEDSGEIFLPIDSVCEMQKSKIKFLITTYANLGIFKTALEKQYLKPGILLDNIKKLCQLYGVEDKLYG